MKLIDVPQPIIDFQAASGSYYRFRRVDGPQSLPVSGGNFICTKGAGADLVVVCAGTASDLSHARSTCTAALADHGATDIYIRLNVTGATRDAENLDILTRYRPIWSLA